MKYKTTAKELRQAGAISTSYCAIQTLLSCESPVAYTCGVYGWNCDVYHIDGAIITTGYNPVGTPAPYDLCREYERKAEKVVSNYNLTFKQKRARLRRLLNNFINKALQEV